MKKALLITSLFLSGAFASHADRILIKESQETSVQEENIDEIFVRVEKKAEFPGGKRALTKYLHENIKYPEKALETGIQGIVMVKFVISQEGKVSRSEVVRSIHPLLDEEALRVVNGMPRWRPAQNGSKNVNSYFTLPVNFKLADSPSTPAPEKDEKGVYLRVDKQAQHPSGMATLMSSIQKNLKYPKKAKKEKTEGTCIVQFVVEADGKIGEISVSRSISPEIDQEAIRLVKGTGAWIPAQSKGENVRSYVKLPINFKLK